MRRRIGGAFFVFCLNLFLFSGFGLTGGVSDFLILQDIYDYKFMGYGGGKGPGIIITADHFDLDHSDESYEAVYFSELKEIGVKVNVAKHAGAESDRWLFHELDLEFRNYYGIPDNSYALKNLEGNIILAFGSGGWDYRWLSGNKVIIIDYTDLDMKKPQPLEVVKAYLAKHPSTLPQMSLVELRSSANKVKWIKDEMERRLWLGEKWFLQLQMGKVEVVEALDRIVKTLAVFLNYRERYYGIKARDEKIALLGYQELKDGTAIKAKLSEYKTWWAVNKTKSISVP